MPAKGSAEWKGDVPTGSGTFTAGDTISAPRPYPTGPYAQTAASTPVLVVT
jgi:hypothetical protein